MNESVLWDSAIRLIITSNSKKVWCQTDNGVPYRVACKGKVREVHKPGSEPIFSAFFFFAPSFTFVFNREDSAHLAAMLSRLATACRRC